MHQNCGRKSFNNTARERASLRSPDLKLESDSTKLLNKKDFSSQERYMRLQDVCSQLYVLAIHYKTARSRNEVFAKYEESTHSQGQFL